MSEENMSKEVMNEEVMSDEAMSAEGFEAGSEMLGSRYFEILDDLEKIQSFIHSEHSSNLFDFEEQLSHYIQYLTDTRQYVATQDSMFWKAMLYNVDRIIGQLTIMSKENTAAICRDGLDRGESAIQKVQEFLARDIEEEKRKDKGAYYDTCDNYARLCERLADELEQRYRPITDDAGSMAKFDEQIKTLRKCKNDLEARFR